MKFKISIFLFLIIFGLFRLKAQNTEGIGLEFSSYPGGTILSESGRIVLPIPLLREEINRIIIIPEYKFATTESLYEIPSNDYQQLGLRAVWQHKLNPDFRMQLILSPVFASLSQKNIAFLMNSAVRLNFKKKYFSAYAGIAFSNRYSNNIITPVAGVNWEPNARWLMSARLPLNMNIQYKAGSRIHVGALMWGNGISGTSESPDYDFVWIHERNIGLYTDFKLTGKIWITCLGGYALNRTLKTYGYPPKDVWTFKTTIGEPGIIPRNEYHENGMFVKIGIKLKVM